LNKVLGIVAGVLLIDHDVRAIDFQQVPYYRIFIMLFLELNAPDQILETINFQVLTAYCNMLSILRPAKVVSSYILTDPKPILTHYISGPWVCLRLARDCVPQGLHWPYLVPDPTAEGVANVCTATDSSFQVPLSIPEER
jgi:hypothetical protein